MTDDNNKSNNLMILPSFLFLPVATEARSPTSTTWAELALAAEDKAPPTMKAADEHDGTTDSINIAAAAAPNRIIILVIIFLGG